VEFVSDPSTKEPAAEIATAVVEAALRRGLLILKAGIYGNCIRVLISLVATDEQIDESLDVLEESLAEALGQQRPAVAGAAG